ncbi:MAG: hypothetical protein E6K80_04330 [Candidatus Eisenbacteria bacterium]|uniref:Uncharacterized protein n=1 Tax=Eiseniibacteriota bacterium TaxID=2212470 RepID=A0A538U7I5_UNCEI|nr:MAG: hypothetical protein E6K80_04330 [Candidatus Eisenbacteria bacterium]
MRTRKLGLNLLLFSLALAALVGAQLVQGPVKVAQSTPVTPEGACASGGIKDEQAPWEATTGEAVIIIDAVIKAGNTTTTISSNGFNGCYDVEGLGTCHATVTGGGTSRDCKDISGVVFCTGPGDGPCGGSCPGWRFFGASRSMSRIAVSGSLFDPIRR